jgi:hypothetical protein
MSIHTNHRQATGTGRVTRAIKSGFAAVALTSAITAFGAIVGAGSASAATATATAQPAAPAVTGVTWHQLSTINGWTSGQSQYGTGGPAWAVQNGVVYLSGSVLQPSSTGQEFAVLPAAARPSKTLFIPVYTLDDTQGYLVIYPTGEMMAWASPESNAQGFTSLAGVSYPAPSLTTHKLTLEDGWKSSNGQYGTGDPSYAVSGGTVYLSGSLHQPVGTSEISTTLPAAARPAHTMYLTVYTYDGTLGLVEIEPNGTMYTYMGGAQQFTSLAGISFPAASDTVHTLALDNGWVSGEPAHDTGDPAYWVSGGVVHLSGSVDQPSGTSEIFAVLPKADRPAHDLYIQVMVYTPDNTAYAGTVLIAPDGAMQAYSQAPGSAQMYTSLAGVSFPLGS